MIIIQFPDELQGQIMQLIGPVDGKDVSYTVKIRKDVDEETIGKLKQLGARVLHSVKESPSV